MDRSDNCIIYRERAEGKLKRQHMSQGEDVSGYCPNPKTKIRPNINLDDVKWYCSLEDMEKMCIFPFQHCKKCQKYFLPHEHSCHFEDQERLQFAVPCDNRK